MFDSLSLHKQLEHPSQNDFSRVDNEEQLVECLSLPSCSLGNIAAELGQEGMLLPRPLQRQLEGCSKARHSGRKMGRVDYFCQGTGGKLP